MLLNPLFFLTLAATSDILLRCRQLGPGSGAAAGLPPLEYSDCFLDSPQFRDIISLYEHEVGENSKLVKQLVSACTSMIQKAEGEYTTHTLPYHRFDYYFYEINTLTFCTVWSCKHDMHEDNQTCGSTIMYGCVFVVV